MNKKIKTAFDFSVFHLKKQRDSIKKSTTEAPPLLRKAGTYLLAGALGIFIFSASLKWISVKRESMAREAELEAGPRVQVATVKMAPTQRTIHVIGEAKPYASVTFYAKVSGYLKEVRVDKGDVIKKGQILAVIESPETDKGYLAALADSNNKRNIAKRMRVLLEKNLVSQQEAEQAISDADVAKARLESQAIQKDYEILRSPFAGTVTARYADPGALVQNATSSQASALPVVTVSQLTELRVYIYLDQKDASFVQINAPVEITVQEKPDLKLKGTVTRISGELDAQTKMLLTEIDLDNKKADLVAGSFVQVQLQITTPPFLEIPTEAIILKADKSFVAVVDKENHVRLKEIRVSNSDGKNVRVLEGLQAGESVALNVGSSLVDGGKVRPVSNNPVEAVGAAKK